MSKKLLVKQVNYESDEDSDNLSNNESNNNSLLEKTDKPIFNNNNTIDILNINDFIINIRVNQRNSKKYITAIDLSCVCQPNSCPCVY